MCYQYATMQRLITWPLSLVALFVFTDVARQYLPALLEPLFVATEGDPDILAALWGVFTITVILLVWRWSAHRSGRS